MRTFTIEEIKNYLLSRDSLGDILYYLNEENIIEANEQVNTNEDKSETTTRYIEEGYHTCPFKTEINDDYSLCNCSPEKTNECSQDI